MKSKPVLDTTTDQNQTKYEYNCQLASNSSLEREKEIIRNGEWVFSQDLEFLPVSRLFKITKIPVIFNLQNCNASIIICHDYVLKRF